MGIGGGKGSSQPPAPTLGDTVQQGISPFLQGPLGFSPATQAAANAWTRTSLPIIQNQLQLQGLGQSPAVAEATSLGLSNALVPFIQGDLSNRFQAAQALQGEEGLNQNAAQLQANIYNQAQQRQLAAAGQYGQLGLGYGQGIALPGAQLQQQQRLGGLQALGTAGGLVRSVYQDMSDAQRAEFLRLMGLAEASSSGLLGGFSPITGTRTTSSSGK